MNLKAKIQLFSLLPALLLALLGGISLGGFWLMDRQVRTIYDDRIIPLQQLKTVSDDYAVAIVDAIGKADANLLTMTEALATVKQARAESKAIWQDYLKTKLTAEEAELAQEIEELFTLADNQLDLLIEILESRDRARLADLKSNLYQTIDPITEKLNDLIVLQRDAAAAERLIATQLYQWILRIFIPLLVITIGVAVSPLRRLISQAITSTLEEMVNTVATTSEEIATVATQQEVIATQQAASVQETTTTMNQLEATSRQSAQQIKTVVERAEQVLALAERGTQAANHTLKEIRQLGVIVDAIATQTQQLQEQAHAIESISRLVDEIAQQTNMLALNASIEAIRAGDQGKGFAVVAAEVRKLAEQTQHSTQSISDRVQAIQQVIQKTVTVTQQSSQSMEAGVILTGETAAAFAGVNSAIEEMVMSSQEIAQSIQQETFAIAQVVEAMNQINQGAKETAWGIGQTKLGTQKLNESTLHLQALV